MQEGMLWIPYDEIARPGCADTKILFRILEMSFVCACEIFNIWQMAENMTKNRDIELYAVRISQIKIKDSYKMTSY